MYAIRLLADTLKIFSPSHFLLSVVQTADRPDVPVMVGWALKINYLGYLSMFKPDCIVSSTAIGLWLIH